eukprot:4379930-Karenia_brevis.AAC.1
MCSKATVQNSAISGSPNDCHNFGKLHRKYVRSPETWAEMYDETMEAVIVMVRMVMIMVVMMKLCQDLIDDWIIAT